MSFEERNTLIFMILTPIIAGYYGLQIREGLIAGDFHGPDGLMVWAQLVIWIIPVGVVACILAVIAGNILYAIFTGDERPDMSSDERDHLIGIRGNRVTVAVAAIFWIVTLIALARGASAITGFNLMFAGFALGDFLGNVAKFISYRMGS